MIILSWAWWIAWLILRDSWASQLLRYTCDHWDHAKALCRNFNTRRHFTVKKITSCLLIICWLVKTNGKAAGHQTKLFLYFLTLQLKFGNISWIWIIPVYYSKVTCVSVIWFTEFSYRELWKSSIFLQIQIFMASLRV